MCLALPGSLRWLAVCQRDNKSLSSEKESMGTGQPQPLHTTDPEVLHLSVFYPPFSTLSFAEFGTCQHSS